MVVSLTSDLALGGELVSRHLNGTAQNLVPGASLLVDDTACALLRDQDVRLPVAKGPDLAGTEGTLQRVLGVFAAARGSVESLLVRGAHLRRAWHSSWQLTTIQVPLGAAHSARAMPL